MKKALIIGVTGQDGFYLAEFLLKKGYAVYGIHRPSSSRVFDPIDSEKITIYYGDLSDVPSLSRVISEVQPDEVYNLAAQSDVVLSDQMPELSMNSDGLGVSKIIEILVCFSKKPVKFCQAASIGTYQSLSDISQVLLPEHPNSAYAVSKLFAYWMGVNKRESSSLFVANALLLNHESPRRGERFVTRKIALSAVKIYLGLKKELLLGSLDAKRDWGHAADYVEALWLMLQQDKPQDYVIATGEQHTVREFCEKSFLRLGIALKWKLNRNDEVGIVDKLVSQSSHCAVKPGDVVVRVDAGIARSGDDSTVIPQAIIDRSANTLNWQPKIKFDDLVREMVDYDLNRLKKEEV